MQSHTTKISSVGVRSPFKLPEVNSFCSITTRVITNFLAILSVGDPYHNGPQFILASLSSSWGKGASNTSARLFTTHWPMET